MLPSALQFIIRQYFKGPLLSLAPCIIFFPADNYAHSHQKKTENQRSFCLSVLETSSNLHVFVSSQNVAQRTTAGSRFFCGIDKIDPSCSKDEGLGTENKTLMWAPLQIPVCSGDVAENAVTLSPEPCTDPQTGNLTHHYKTNVLIQSQLQQGLGKWKSACPLRDDV